MVYLFNFIIELTFPKILNLITIKLLIINVIHYYFIIIVFIKFFKVLMMIFINDIVDFPLIFN